MPRGDLATARLHRAWLKELPRLTGKALTALAKDINVAPSTLTRPLRDGDDGTSTLHANTITKVVEHTGVAGPTDVAPQKSGRGSGHGFGEEAAPFEAGASDPLRAAVAALIGERRAVTPWLIKSRSLDLAGILPGDVVLVDLGAVDAKPGDLVCAQIYDWPKMTAQTVMREFQRVGATNVLISRSSDPTLHHMVPVDGERVIIKGLLLPHRLRP